MIVTRSFAFDGHKVRTSEFSGNVSRTRGKSVSVSEMVAPLSGSFLVMTFGTMISLANGKKVGAPKKKI